MEDDLAVCWVAAGDDLAKVILNRGSSGTHQGVDPGYLQTKKSRKHNCALALETLYEEYYWKGGIPSVRLRRDHAVAESDRPAKLAKKRSGRLRCRSMPQYVS